MIILVVIFLTVCTQGSQSESIRICHGMGTSPKDISWGYVTAEAFMTAIQRMQNQDTTSMITEYVQLNMLAKGTTGSTINSLWDDMVVKRNCSFIVSSHVNLYESAIQAAVRHPTVYFAISTDAEKSNTVLSNVVEFSYSMQDAMYLAGMVAGDALHDGDCVGFIIQSQQSTNEHMRVNSFTLGLRSIRKNSTVKVISIDKEPDAEIYAAQLLDEYGKCAIVFSCTEYNRETEVYVQSRPYSLWTIGYVADGRLFVGEEVLVSVVLRPEVIFNELMEEYIHTKAIASGHRRYGWSSKAVVLSSISGRFKISQQLNSSLMNRQTQLLTNENVIFCNSVRTNEGQLLTFAPCATEVDMKFWVDGVFLHGPIVLPSSCHSGYYFHRDRSMLKTECRPCPENMYSNSFESYCLPCPAGLTSSPGSITCSTFNDDTTNFYFLLLLSPILIFPMIFWKKQNLTLSYKQFSSAPRGSYVCFVLLDLECRTTLRFRFPRAMQEAIPMYYNTVRSLCSEYAAYIVTQKQDFFLLACHSSDDAIAFALDIQVTLNKLNWPSEVKFCDGVGRGPDVVWQGPRVRCCVHDAFDVVTSFSLCSMSFQYTALQLDRCFDMFGKANGGQILVADDFWQRFQQTALFSTIFSAECATQPYSTHTLSVCPSELCSRWFPEYEMTSNTSALSKSDTEDGCSGSLQESQQIERIKRDTEMVELLSLRTLMRVMPADVIHNLGKHYGIDSVSANTLRDKLAQHAFHLGCAKRHGTDSSREDIEIPESN